MIYVIVISSDWNKDFKPSAYPATKQEREAAAKKYFLLPEEYRPYADDGLGQGDYPKFDDGLGVENKDSFYPYDFPEHKRNFNEPVSNFIIQNVVLSRPTFPCFFWGRRVVKRNFRVNQTFFVD